jgi:multiple sugar transport system permease protein
LISKNIEWLTQPKTAMFALICANVWIGIPFNMILISTGLTTIPQELYESASMDGATRTDAFFKITLPLLRPTIESVLVLGFIYTFKVYDLVYVMTGGGPVNATHMLSTYSYKLSFEMFQYSRGASVANVLFVVLMLVSILYIRITTQGEEEQDDA